MTPEQETRELLGRIDERTDHLLEAFKSHEQRDRTDFKEVHTRINRLERKQNWILGVGSVIVFAIGASMVWLRGLFGV